MIPSTLPPTKLGKQEFYDLQNRQMLHYVQLLSDRESLKPERSVEGKQIKLLEEIKRITKWMKESEFNEDEIVGYSVQEWGLETGY